MKRLMAIGLCCGLLACGTTKKTNPPPAVVKSADFVQGVLQYVCGSMACYDGYSLKACPYVASDLAPLQKALDAGRIKLDQTAAAACLKAVKTLDPKACWGENADKKAFDAADKTCSAAFHGTVALGGSCYDTGECAAGWCDTSNNACPGKCAAPKAAGTDCTADAECQSGLSCDFGSSKCTALLQKGEDCSQHQFGCASDLYCNASGKCDNATVAVGGDCSGSAPCAVGSWCKQLPEDCSTATDCTCGDFTTSCHTDADCTDGSSCTGFGSSGVCTAQAHADAACDDPGFFSIQASDCLGAQVCVGATGDGSDAGKCATPSDVNGTCNPDGTAGPGAAGCYAGLGCDQGTKKCLLLPTTAGATCVGGQCGGTLLCDDTKKCEEPPTTAGKPCVQQECGGDLVCDDADNTCKALPTTAGAPCINSRCGKDLTCDDNSQCQPLPGTGQSCATTFECVDGDYCDSATQNCLAQKAAGEACTDSTECKGSCDQTTSKCVGDGTSTATCTEP